jgi:response regulator RpfG family c-di-GMP phosphodiesterase
VSPSQRILFKHWPSSFPAVEDAGRRGEQDRRGDEERKGIIKAKQSEVIKTLETILLVDDEDYIRELVSAILTIEGYNILEAESGPKALQVSEEFKGPIHLLLTDVVMNPMSGSELVMHFSPQRPETRILYISGFPDDAIVQYGIKQSQVSFLAKPFTPKVLVQKIREVLEKSAVQA